jgi:hypothetical protein
MSVLSGTLNGAAISIDIHATEPTAQHLIGSKFESQDKRVFRYAKVGASNISRGKLQLAPAPKTNHHNVAWASGGALGATTVTVTLGATAAVANEYAEGLLVVNDATGEGTSYRIASHPAADASATLQLTLSDPIKNVALVSGSEVSLVHNAYNGVVEGTTVTRRAAGVPLVNATAGTFVWLQTGGVCPVLCDTTTTLGAKQKAGAVAGSVTDMTDILGASAEVEVGTADVMAGVDTEYRPITLTIN